MLAVEMRKNVIKNLMDKRGISIYALAKAIQMPWHNVNKIVTAPAIPDGTEYKTLLRIASALEVKIDDLEVDED